jgi:hypothetical protein
LNSPTDKHPSPERVAPAPGPGDRLADALTGALQRSFPHGVAPAPDAQEPVPAGWPISPDDPPCVCGHTLPMHLWIDGKRVESLSGCGNRYCDCDHYRPAQAPAVAQPSGAAEPKQGISDEHDRRARLAEQNAVLRDALASAQQERDNWEEAWRLTQEAGNRVAAERDSAQAQIAALTARVAQREDWLYAIQRSISRHEAHVRPLDGTWTCTCDVCHPLQQFMLAASTPAADTPTPQE